MRRVGESLGGWRGWRKGRGSHQEEVWLPSREGVAASHPGGRGYESPIWGGSSGIE